MLYQILLNNELQEVEEQVLEVLLRRSLCRITFYQCSNKIIAQDGLLVFRQDEDKSTRIWSIAPADTSTSDEYRNLVSAVKCEEDIQNEDLPFVVLDLIVSQEAIYISKIGIHKFLVLASLLHSFNELTSFHLGNNFAWSVCFGVKLNVKLLDELVKENKAGRNSKVFISLHKYC